MGSCLSSPSVFEVGNCSKHAQANFGPSFMGQIVLESSNLKCHFDLSSNTSGLTATEQPVSSVVLPIPSGKLAMVPMVPLVMISPIVVAEVVGDVGVGGQISLI